MQWYYAQQGQRFGPVSLPELQRLATTGGLQPKDMVIQAGAQQWVAAATVDQLFPPLLLDVRAADPPAPFPLAQAAGIIHHPQPTGGHSLPIRVGEKEGPSVPPWLAAVPKHVGRAFAGNVRRLSVTPNEEKVLVARGMANPSMRSYYTWRRSVLFVACLPVLLLAILATIDQASGTIPNLSVFGRLWLALLILAPFALPITAVAAALTWSRPRASGWILIVGWMIATLGPLALYLVPGPWLYDFGNVPESSQELAKTAIGLMFGLIFFMVLWVQLPVVIMSTSSGVRQACLQLKTLLPASPVPGLFLAATGLVLPVVLFPLFVLVVQVASSPLLLLGLPLLMASSLVYTFRAGPFVRPLKSPADYASLNRVQWLARGLFWGGVLFLLIYALTKEWPAPREGAMADFMRWLAGTLSGRPSGVDPSKVLNHKTLLGFSADTSYLRPWSWRVFRWLVVEMLGRSLFTSVVFADLFLGVSLRVGRHTRPATDGTTEENYDQLMGTVPKTKD